MYKLTKEEKKLWREQMFESFKKAAVDKNIELQPEDIKIEIKKARIEDATDSLDEQLGIQRFNEWGLSFSVYFNEKKFKGEDIQEIIKIAGEKYGMGPYAPEFGKFKLENWKAN